jgi:hypothetical protein
MNKGHCMSATTTQRIDTSNRKTRSAIAVPATEPQTPIAQPAKPRQSGSSNIVFQVLLGAAACLALVAVVQQATHTSVDPTGVDAPPPAVFVQTD